VKAADISDEEFIRAVVKCAADYGGNWAMARNVFDEFPTFPPKVVQAKARQLLKRGWLEGCGCGCRGDWHVPSGPFEKLPDNAPEWLVELSDDVRDPEISLVIYPLPNFSGPVSFS